MHSWQSIAPLEIQHQPTIQERNTEGHASISKSCVMH